ncbi:MAG: hypothetical protein KM310_09525 [Clostridiales bacterium]|nr:hypothetical protein [Clostridiales bacterium]
MDQEPRLLLVEDDDGFACHLPMELTLDLGSREAKVRGKVLNLTRRELDLLHHLRLRARPSAGRLFWRPSGDMPTWWTSIPGTLGKSWGRPPARYLQTVRDMCRLQVKP